MMPEYMLVAYATLVLINAILKETNETIILVGEIKKNMKQM